MILSKFLDEKHINQISLAEIEGNNFGDDSGAGDDSDVCIFLDEFPPMPMSANSDGLIKHYTT